MADQDTLDLEAALKGLEGTAATFATMMIADEKARAQYNKLIKEFTGEIRAKYGQGVITARQGAEAAHQARNEILDMIRARSSPIGKARAKQLKAKGLALDDLVEKYAQKFFRKPFAQLSAAEQTRVYEEVMEAAGRANPKVNAQVKRLGRLGRGLWFVTAGFAIYNVAVAEDKMRAFVKEGVVIGGGIGGGWAVGAAGGALFGPPGAIIGAIIGGVLGSLLADQAFEAAASYQPSGNGSGCTMDTAPCYLGGGAVLGRDGIIRQGAGPKF